MLPKSVYGQTGTKPNAPTHGSFLHWKETAKTKWNGNKRGKAKRHTPCKKDHLSNERSSGKLWLKPLLWMLGKLFSHQKNRWLDPVLAPWILLSLQGKVCVWIEVETCERRKCEKKNSMNMSYVNRIC